MHPSWLKAFLITPVVTWIVSYFGYWLFGFTPNAYLLSGIPAGIISAMVYYHLLPRARFVISIVTYSALQVMQHYFPATSASGDLQEISYASGIVFSVAAGIGILISVVMHKQPHR